MIITIIIIFFLVIPMFFIAQPVGLLLQQKALRVKKSDCPAWNVTDGKLIHWLPKLLFFKSSFPPPHEQKTVDLYCLCSAILPFTTFVFHFPNTSDFQFCSLLVYSELIYLEAWESEGGPGSTFNYDGLPPRPHRSLASSFISCALMKKQEGQEEGNAWKKVAAGSFPGT